LHAPPTRRTGNHSTVRFRPPPQPVGSGRVLEAKLRCGVSGGRWLAVPVFGQDASFADLDRPTVDRQPGESASGTVPGHHPAYVRLLHPVVDEDVVHAWEVAAEFGTRTQPLVQ
jgi:hypothetical protein